MQTFIVELTHIITRWNGIYLAVKLCIQGAGIFLYYYYYLKHVGFSSSWCPFKFYQMVATVPHLH